MAAQKSSGGNFLVSLLLFVTAAGIAVLLLLVSAVVWLSALLDSFIFSTLILGGVFTLVATAIYFLSMRKSLAHIREQAETIYEVARLAKNAYEWLAEKLRWIRAIWNFGTEKPV